MAPSRRADFTLAPETHALPPARPMFLQISAVPAPSLPLALRSKVISSVGHFLTALPPSPGLPYPSLCFISQHRLITTKSLFSCVWSISLLECKGLRAGALSVSFTAGSPALRTVPGMWWALNKFHDYMKELGRLQIIPFLSGPVLGPN